MVVLHSQLGACDGSVDLCSVLFEPINSTERTWQSKLVGSCRTPLHCNTDLQSSLMKLLNISTRAVLLVWLQSVPEQIGLSQGSQCECVFELIKMSEESLLLISPHCSALSLSLHSDC